MERYAELNRTYWDSRAAAHARDGYRVERFIDDPSFVSHTVRFDQPRLGEVAGLRAVHLQCHIGTDTISLARLGAQVTGLDLSPASLAEARALAARCGADVEFVVSDVYDALDVLPGGAFDLVYTGIGALCWLPSVERWAGVVAGLLAPGGRLFIRDTHPMLYALDEHDLRLEFPYFEVEQPIVQEASGTYVDTAAELPVLATMEWNHALGQTVTALLDQGLVIAGLAEHDSAPWDFMPGRTVHDDLIDEWRLAERPERLAATFTLQAVRPPGDGAAHARR